MGKLIHEELSRSIIGAAMAVLSELKPGLDEKIYENALLLELVARGHQVKQQDQFPVYYREQKVGVLVPDLIVDDLVIADPKVVALSAKAMWRRWWATSRSRTFNLHSCLTLSSPSWR